MQEQNVKNHAHMVPLYHYILTVILGLILGGSLYKLYGSYRTHFGGLLVPALLVGISIALLLLAYFSRRFAIIAQDRAIRAEENLRYFAITGKLMDSKLRIGQIIALRFASNNEFVDLAHKAAAEDLSSGQIKSLIGHWRADHHRV